MVGVGLRTSTPRSADRRPFDTSHGHADDRALPHGVEFVESGLDLAEFDPVATMLDLGVAPAVEEEEAVAIAAAEIELDRKSVV